MEEENNNNGYGQTTFGGYNSTDWNDITENAKNYANSDIGRNYGLGTSIFDPSLVQQVEFGQEVAKQEMQNQWNSEKARMDRMKAAGINPNTAAAGIAGSGNAPSAGSPNSAIGAGANSLNSVAQSLGSLGSLASGFAGAFDSVASGYETFKMLKGRQDNLSADTFSKLQEAGFTEIQTKIAEIALKYADDNAFADLRTKWLNMDNLIEQRGVLESEHNLNLQKIRESVSKENLNFAQASVQEQLVLNYQAELLKIQEETRYQRAINDFYNTYGFFPSQSNIHAILAQCLANGKSDMYNAFCAAGFDFETGIQSARQEAQMQIDESRIRKEKEAQKELNKQRFDLDSLLQSMKYASEEDLVRLRGSIDETIARMHAAANVTGSVIKAGTSLYTK